MQGKLEISTEDGQTAQLRAGSDKKKKTAFDSQQGKGKKTTTLTGEMHGRDHGIHTKREKRKGRSPILTGPIGELFGKISVKAMKKGRYTMMKKDATDIEGVESQRGK